MRTDLVDLSEMAEEEDLWALGGIRTEKIALKSLTPRLLTKLDTDVYVI